MISTRPDHAAEIKRSLADPHRVCEALGLTAGGPRSYARQAAGIIVRCPSHEDRTPSCSVQNRQGVLLWRCHGCGAHGDALSLVAAVRGLNAERDFRAVLVEAASIAGLWQLVDELDGRAPSTPRPAPPARPPPPPPERTIDVERFDEIARALFEVCPLTPHSHAGRYLGGRGLFDEAHAAGLGSMPLPGREQDALCALLVDGFGTSDLELAGLLRVGRLAWPRHVLLIPWKTRGGKIATLQRRLVAPAEHLPSYVFAKGLRPVDPFGAHALDAAGPHAALAFVEGALDALALRAIIRGRSAHVVLGVPGVGTWREAWNEYARGRRVVVAFDADTAGDRAADARVSALRLVAAEVRRARPRFGKDWGEQIGHGATERRTA